LIYAKPADGYVVHVRFEDGLIRVAPTPTGEGDPAGRLWNPDGGSNYDALVEQAGRLSNPAFIRRLRSLLDD
jgi:hypothetical protein